MAFENQLDGKSLRARLQISEKIVMESDDVNKLYSEQLNLTRLESELFALMEQKKDVRQERNIVKADLSICQALLNVVQKRQTDLRDGAIKFRKEARIILDKNVFEQIEKASK